MTSDNRSADISSECESDDMTSWEEKMDALYTYFYLFLFVPGLLLNTVALWVLCRHIRYSTDVHAFTHACTHARTHARMHARTHAHTHTCRLFIFIWIQIYKKGEKDPNRLGRSIDRLGSASSHAFTRPS